MKNRLTVLILIAIVGFWAAPVPAQNPFTAKPATRQKALPPPIENPFFVKTIVWQHQLKQKMADLVRTTRTAEDIRPLLFLMGLAFCYGAIHAAGPGHGKFVAISYMLSHKASVANGLLFGTLTAFFHGFSGAVGVLGLRCIIRMGVGETLGSVTSVTQVISFGLIALLGLGLLLANGRRLFFRPASGSAAPPAPASGRGLLPWALAIGLVPCPAVVMVMLFCLSMEVLPLGLILAACISLGMAATISLAVVTVVVGRDTALRTLSKNRAETIERILGLVSGLAVTLFGTVFLLAAIG